MSDMLKDPEEFMRHVIEKHGFLDTVESWMNIPTHRAYHDFLHRERQDEQDHVHV